LASNHSPTSDAVGAAARALSGSNENWISKSNKFSLSVLWQAKHFHFYRFPINVNDRSDRSGNSAMPFRLLSMLCAACWILNFRLFCFLHRVASMSGIHCTKRADDDAGILSFLLGELF
jgi:hypothetical protein